ncbi:N-6 DNA methylase [Marinifilum fragile]|uniref:N-6 DNA methylase n=1 Tax=Marinifilum fragile TaxID=570161 RepID=UPI002AA7B2CD|nr:N-6 DNA methylase [Marinifilum fragile]
MDNKVHNQIVSFIWGIADDVLRDVFVRGKYRDIILPFTVLRRLDALLVPTKEKVLEAVEFMEKEKIDDRSALKAVTGYPFWNTSKFTFESLLNDSDNIDSNLEVYLDGYSPNVQEIISKFKLRNQLETMKENEITYLLIEKFASKEINVSPNEALNGKGDKMPPLTNLGMGYVFEELIRKFNEENNEEAGEHFTPREIIKLMTHILFLPVKDQISKGTHLIYDPACGSGGMLTEAEQFALDVTDNKASFLLYGQEVNPETFAICTSDMLIKGEKPENIAFGSTLSKDGFSNLHFDFMLSNPPYGKTWKLDENAIVDNRGKKGSGENAENIKDPRFQVGLPTISDGQLLFLMNMVSKMKHNTELGSRIATVHNGSALFTGDAGGGESEIRKHIIESDWLDCIIALPKNIFYNTGIPTYVWIVNNRKPANRKGKVQLINALELYVKLRKNLGDKNCEMTAEHIDQITKLYMDFEESDISKIFPNEYFGYNKITVERPLRLSAQFTEEALKTLRFEKSIADEMTWAYEKFGDDVYTKLKDLKPDIEKHLAKHEIKLKATQKKNLFSQDFWKAQKEVLNNASKLMDIIGTEQHDDFNTFLVLLANTIKGEKLKLDNKAQKAILNAITWKNEEAEAVIKKTEKDGTIVYEADGDLRDTENVPLDEDIQTYFEREVLQHVPDLPAPKPLPGEFCVYILKCADGSFYKGQSNNLERRLQEHNIGEVSWTAKNLPVELVHWEVFKTRDEAVEREKYLKSGRGREWIQKQYENKTLMVFERQAGAWIDHKKTVKGYEISFTRYFYNYVPPRSIEEITAEILQLEQETDGILNEIVKNV